MTPRRVTGVSLPAMLRKGCEIVGFDFSTKFNMIKRCNLLKKYLV